MFNPLQFVSAPLLQKSQMVPMTQLNIPRVQSAHGVGANESPFVKFMISGTVALSFELCIGHYMEFLKIRKQTSELSYAQITRNMVQSKGIIGVLDGFFPWGAIQCFVKGASFGFGQALGMNLIRSYTQLPDFWAEVASGGFGGGVQGLVMSPLLLLKTRVMTMPEMRSVKGVIGTSIASARVGMVVIKNEGMSGLMKGSMIFTSKRVADWTTRFLFAELSADWIKMYIQRTQPDRIKEKNGQKHIDLTFTEKSIASLSGGALSATATIPLDVLVATFQDASKAGQKMSIASVWKEKIREKGVFGLVQYSSKGYVARVAHVAATTLLMKSVSSAVYGVYTKIAHKSPL